jgi:hypothetical protein
MRSSQAGRQGKLLPCQAGRQGNDSRKFDGTIICQHVTVNVYQRASILTDTRIAKIFMHDRSQAVRLPLAVRLLGDRVRACAA